MATLDSICTTVKANRLRGASLALLQSEVLDVHKLIHALIPDLRLNIGTPLEISLTNNTRAYTLDPSMLQVSQVILQQTGSVYSKLKPATAYRFMDQAVSTTPWLKASAGVIADLTEYAIAGVLTGAATAARQILLNGWPAVAASEKLLVYGTQVETAITTSTVVSTRLLSSMVYVEGLSWRAALTVRPADASAYYDSFQAAIEIEKALIRTELQELSTSDSVKENVRTEN